MLPIFKGRAIIPLGKKTMESAATHADMVADFADGFVGIFDQHLFGLFKTEGIEPRFEIATVSVAEEAGERVAVESHFFDKVTAAGFIEITFAGNPVVDIFLVGSIVFFIIH